VASRPLKFYLNMFHQVSSPKSIWFIPSTTVVILSVRKYAINTVEKINGSIIIEYPIINIK
jgi:hypothetical protein